MAQNKRMLSGLLSNVLLQLKTWPTYRFILAVCLFLLVIGIPLVIDVPSLETLRQWAVSFGDQFVIIFCGLYIFTTQFPIPRTVMTLASGILFGPILGAFIALACTTLSAALSIVLVRWIFGEQMSKHLSHPAVRKIDARLQKRGWLSAASLRMIAGVPFSLLNYVAALTTIPVSAFAFSTFIGSAPGTVIMVFLGDSLVGSGDLRILMATIVFAILGILGLVLDYRLPVKSKD